jgi:ABC-type transport system involved in multi-copper enzyme maturation permease subunit
MSPVRALLVKELRQARRSRGAIVSAAVLSLLLMVVTPFGQLFALRASGGNLPPNMGGLPFGDLGDDPMVAFGHVLFPLFVSFAGLLVPSVAAVHTVVVERERRSVELLIALPVQVRDILVAKLIATLALSSAVLVPLFLIDVAGMLAFGLLDPALALGLLVLLFAAELCSICLALLVALLARDFRTANNLNGATLGPAVLLISGVMLGAPAYLRLPALVGLLLVIAVVAVAVALRWLTFERYVA